MRSRATACKHNLLEIWQANTKTVLFVTHSVDEAVFLSDRVIVLSPHPGRLKMVVPVELPRPRDIASPEFNRLKRVLLDAIAPDMPRQRGRKIGISALARARASASSSNAGPMNVIPIGPPSRIASLGIASAHRSKRFTKFV